MKTFTFAFCLVLVVPVGGVGTGAGAQEMSAEDKAMMEAMEKAATPGDPHKKLEALAGTWDAQSKFWMDPSAPPQESKGTSTNKMLYNGRYLYQKYQGQMMGQTFRGMGVWGYDNVKKKFVSSWLDNSSTGISYSEGEWDADKNTIVFHSERIDPVTSKPVKEKMVIGIVSEDKHVFEVFMIDEGGKGMSRRMLNLG